MAKKLLALFLAFLMVGMMVACGGNNAPDSSNGSSDAGDAGNSVSSDSGESKEKVKITFSLDQGLAEVTQMAVDNYNASQDKYEVVLAVLPQDTNTVHDDFVNKLAVEDTSVDIMNLDATYMAEFASADWVLDLSEYFDESVRAEYLSGSIDQMTYNGKLIAMPYLTNASVLFYRQDVIDELGVDVPTTYQGWIDLAEQAVGVNGVEYVSLFQAAQSEALVCNWCEFIWSNGGNVLDENGNPVANSENNIQATNIMLDLIENYAPDGITTYAETESEQVFLEGKALYLRDWSGFWTTANGESSKVAGKVGVTTLPYGPEGDAGHACLGGSGLVVNKYIDDEHKTGAIDFITYLTSFEVMKEICIASTQPPTHKAVYTDPDVLEAIPFYSEFGSVIEEAMARPKAQEYAKVSDSIQRNVHQALTGEVDVVSALNALQAELEAMD